MPVFDAPARGPGTSDEEATRSGLWGVVRSSAGERRRDERPRRPAPVAAAPPVSRPPPGRGTRRPRRNGISRRRPAPCATRRRPPGRRLSPKRHPRCGKTRGRNRERSPRIPTASAQSAPKRRLTRSRFQKVVVPITRSSKLDPSFLVNRRRPPQSSHVIVSCGGASSTRSARTPRCRLDRPHEFHIIRERWK